MNIKKLSKPVVYLLLIIWTILVTYPLIYMFITSVKSHGEILRNPFGLPEQLKLSNYVTALTDYAMGSALLNSIMVTVGSLVILIFVAAMAGYAVAKKAFPGNKIFFITMVAFIAIPIHALVVPVYYFIENLGLTNNLFAIMIIYAAFHLPISILIMRSFFETVPNAVEEAARIDGCSEFKTFWYIALPMTKVGMATVAIINVITIWSEYMFASVLLTRPESRTLPVAVGAVSSGNSGFDHGIFFASLGIATIPMLIIYFVFSKQITKGVASGAVK
ncbi:ABC-type sugar transport system [Gracilibacillus boraciitolerans JCM 21714]|uniref:ABC-type sugar transport system n=1 Tax=Gracilibacillus boraciitolerans JCM 21714 TaxID=1298598 RepID=W4VQK7_9BACI|nr:carbohydrate ABC transporter permease [Gracilibacillus boraciitolerans]GAE95054.1 ABC-type sugar transport system [Gracilibacillus boraciitolerans JCM 21714]